MHDFVLYTAVPAPDVAVSIQDGHCCSWYRVYIYRVGQNQIYTPYLTVHLVIFLPRIPCVHRKYMVQANPTDVNT